MLEGSSWSMVSVRGVVCILVISEKLVKGCGGLCLKDSCTYQLAFISRPRDLLQTRRCSAVCNISETSPGFIRLCFEKWVLYLL